MRTHEYFALTFAASALLVAAIFPVAQGGKAQASSEGGVLLRALMIAPEASGAPAFEPGTPIAESSLAGEEDFSLALRQRNPGWAVQSLGTLWLPLSDPQASLTDSGLSATAAVSDWSSRPDGTLSATVRMSLQARSPAVAGFGLASDHLRLDLPADQAFLIAHLSDEGNPARLVVFASLLSPKAIAQRKASPLRLAQNRRKPAPPSRGTAVKRKREKPPVRPNGKRRPQVSLKNRSKG